jgi:hypothetical protein
MGFKMKTKTKISKLEDKNLSKLLGDFIKK